MDSIKDYLIQELKNCPRELIARVQQIIADNEDELIRHQNSLSIIHATDAFLEAKLPEEKIIFLLQKHWDMRRSEAVNAIEQAKNRAARG